MRDPIDQALTEYAIAREIYLWNRLFREVNTSEEQE